MIWLALVLNREKFIIPELSQVITRLGNGVLRYGCETPNAIK